MYSKIIKQIAPYGTIVCAYRSEWCGTAQNGDKQLRIALNKKHALSGINEAIIICSIAVMSALLELSLLPCRNSEL